MKTRARERFQQILGGGSRPLGAFVMSNDPSTSAIFASAGYDFVVIDREHGMIDLSAAVGHVRAVEVGGAIPFIRVLEGSPALIQQALDAGAHGIIVPKVEDADQAARLVRATRYEVAGRGKCPQAPGAEFLSTDWQSRAARHNENVVLVPLLETVAGVENAGAIAAVDGIDYLFFGPADLSQDLGLDMYADSDQIREIFNKAQKAVHAAGALLGAPRGFGLDDEADFITLASDVGSIRAMAADGLKQFRTTKS